MAPELLIETFSRCCSLMSDEHSSSYNDMQLKNTIHQVLIALEPWVQSIKLEELTKGGKRQVCNRILLEFYDITSILSVKFEGDIESLGLLSNEELQVLAPSESRNRSGLLAFSRRKDGNAKISNMISGDITKSEKSELIKSFESNLFLVPKRIGLYLARVAPQECIDRLVLGRFLSRFRTRERNLLERRRFVPLLY